MACLATENEPEITACDAMMAAAERAFGGWVKGEVPTLTFAAPPALSGRHVYFVQRPNSIQSSIALGNVAVKRSDPRWFETTLANTIYGGAFNSRIVRNIREEKGYTYSPGSTLTGYRWPISQGRITLPFKAIPGGEWFNGTKLWHDGVDMASFCGARVGAAHDGIVLAAGRHFDEQIGWLGDLQPYFHLLDRRHMWNDLPIVVVIDDGNGYRSIYAHFLDVKVRVGQHSDKGRKEVNQDFYGVTIPAEPTLGSGSGAETRRPPGPPSAQDSPSA